MRKGSSDPPRSSDLIIKSRAEGDSSDDSDQQDQDEDEETLELKLQEIQARLKLKRAQAKRRKGPGVDNVNVSHHAKNDGSKSKDPQGRSQSTVADEPVLVPVSPPRKHRPAQTNQRSPARVLLGLENRATDVSLKRALSTAASNAKSQPHREMPKIKSFSERMAEGRANDQARQVKDERILRSRSAAFDFNPATRAGPKSHTRHTSRSEKTAQKPEQPSSRLRLPSDTRAPQNEDEVPKSDASFDPYSSLHLSKRHMEHTDVTRILDGKQIYTLPRLLKEVKAPEYEPPDCETDYVVLGILASKSSPYDIKKPARPTATADIDKDDNEDDGTNPLIESRKFMVLKLIDLNWELDLFLFGHAFREHWKLTPGTLLAVLNPEILPPKVKTDSGRFSLKLNSSEDQILEIGVARDLGYCKSVKRDGGACHAWVNRRKTEYCDFHVNMMLEKTRAGRMEVNGMARGKMGSGGGSSTTRSRPGKSGDGAPKGGRRKDPETGEWYYAPAGTTTASTIALPQASRRLQAHDEDYSHVGLSTRQIMDVAELARPEQMRKRLEAKEKERATALKLGAMGNGIGAEYLRLTTTATDKRKAGRPRLAADADADALERGSGSVALEDPDDDGKPDAMALGLIATSASRKLGAGSSGTASSKASNISTAGPAKRKRDGGGATTGTATGTDSGRAASGQIGWGGAFKRGLIDGRKVITSTTGASSRREMAVPTEKGQKTLRGMGTGFDGLEAFGPKPGFADHGDENTLAAGADAGSVGGSTIGSPVVGRVRKRARLDLGEQGIKEPGRDSIGDLPRSNSAADTAALDGGGNESEDGDELDIVM